MLSTGRVDLGDTAGDTSPRAPLRVEDETVAFHAGSISFLWRLLFITIEKSYEYDLQSLETSRRCSSGGHAGDN